MPPASPPRTDQQGDHGDAACLTPVITRCTQTRRRLRRKKLAAAARVWATGGHGAGSGWRSCGARHGGSTAAAAAIRRHVVTRRHRASSRRCWTRSGDATPSQAHAGAPAGRGLWLGVRLAILRRAARRQRLRSVDTWPRDGSARARGAAGRAPETLPQPLPVLGLRPARNRSLRNGRTTERARTAQAGASR